MVENIIQLPLELLYETLGHCSFRDLWAFTKASRACYLIGFRVLVSKHDFPLTLPHAITSGLLQQHKVDGVYDLIQSVAVDVTKEAWAKYGDDPSYTKELVAFLESERRSGDGQIGVRIYTPGGAGGCSVTAFMSLFKLVFLTTTRTIGSLTIRISIDEDDESQFVNSGENLKLFLRGALWGKPLPTRSAQWPDTAHLPIRSLDIKVESSWALALTNTQTFVDEVDLFVDEADPSMEVNDENNDATPRFPLFTTEDLGDKPTDPIDLEVMRAMMLEKGDPNRWHALGWEVNTKHFYRFMGGYAHRLVEAGDRIKGRDGESVWDQSINQRGAKCQNCDGA
ncbi:hypothetical protein ABW20_dc0107019 [Dactylellina cionopaga]|nr:hypothetical protein ABW20_dc0107019 [Dactylellina cionopaga]